MARKKKSSGGGGGAYWMDTYGDMVTLILTFFILLYSFSTINEKKWAALVYAMTGKDSTIENFDDTDIDVPDNFSPDPSATLGYPPEATPGPDDPDKISSDNLEQLYQSIKSYIAASGMEASIEVSKTDLEIVIKLLDNIMFDSGSALLKDDSFIILSNISDALVQYGEQINMVRIEGHTDDRQINTPQYPSNWELSTARAVNVLKYLIEEKGFDKNKISAVGYGEYHPIDTNTTPEGRSKNRRVVFVITRVVSMDAE